MSKLTTTALAFAVVTASAAIAVPAAFAKDGDLRVAGTCTAAATSKLKLSAENGGVEVEFEVDQNRVGVPWRVTLRHNGALVTARTATTRAPSGSFTVRRVIAATAGNVHRVVAVATSRSGATCRASAAL